MPRTTGIAASVAAAGMLVFAALPARAQEEDTQLWTTFALAGPIGPRVEASIETSPRARAEGSGGDQVLSRVMAEYRLSPSVSAGGGVSYVEFAGGNEWRPHQQVIFNTGPLAFRTRLEQRFFAGADRMELRLRQRMQASFSLPGSTTLGMAAEVLGLVQTRNSAENARIEQWRAQLFVRRRVARQLEASIGYLLILSPRDGRPDRLSHVPQIALTIRP